MLGTGSFIGGIALSFSGIIAGAVIAFFTPAEVAAGRRHFAVLQRILLIAFGALVISSLSLRLVPSLLLLAALSSIVFAANPGKYAVAISPVLGLLLWLLSSTPIFFLYGSALLFLYWLVTGTREYQLGWAMAWHSSFLLGAALPFLLV